MDGTGAGKGEEAEAAREPPYVDPELARRLADRGFYLFGAVLVPSGTGGDDTGAS